MKKIISLILFLGLIFPCHAQSQTKRILISFKSKTSAAFRVRAITSIKGKLINSISSNGEDFLVSVVDVPSDVINSGGWIPFLKPSPDKSIMGLIPDDVKLSIMKIEEDFRVRWIEEPSEIKTFQESPLPSLSTIMGILPKFKMTSSIRPEITWGVERVNAPAAWQVTEGKGVRVAVIDTGIDSSHPDLVGQVSGGYSAITKSEKKEEYQDQNGHGTHVAGTIAALKNGVGVVGVAPKVRLYSVRVLDEDGSGSLSDVIDGIIWCANNNIQVANMSLGSSSPSETMQRALRFAMYSGVVTVAAAGNSGGPLGYPGAYPEVIGIAASDANDNVATFSSRGPEVDFIAPGVDVVSAKMRGGHVSFSGTSMATPHVAGLVALAVSQGWVGLNGPDGVYLQLKKAAKKLPGLKDEEQGNGMIDGGLLVK